MARIRPNTLTLLSTLGALTLSTSLAFADPSRARAADVDVSLDEATTARLVSEIGRGRQPLAPAIRFTTPGISESSPLATGITIENAVRLTEAGRAEVFFNNARIIVQHVEPETRKILQSALAKGELRSEVERPGTDGVGALVLAGKFGFRRTGTIQLGQRVSLPRFSVGKTILRVPVRLDGIRGYFDRTLTFHSGPRSTVRVH